MLAPLESCGPALVLPLVVPCIGAPVDIGLWPVVWEEVFLWPVSWQTVWVRQLPSRPSKSKSDDVLVITFELKMQEDFERTNGRHPSPPLNHYRAWALPLQSMNDAIRVQPNCHKHAFIYAQKAKTGGSKGESSCIDSA